MPSRDLVQFYDDTFDCEGLLTSLFEVAIHARQRERRRAGGQHPRLTRAIPGDASTFVKDTVPNGTLLRPGQWFLKTWWIKNSGTVPWKERQLERQGPITGPGLISSTPGVPVPDTEPGGIAVVSAPLKAPTYDCASIAYFKMVGADGQLSFPDTYQLGLEVLVLVRGQRPDLPSSLDQRLVSEDV